MGIKRLIDFCWAEDVYTEGQESLTSYKKTPQPAIFPVSRNHIIINLVTCSWSLCHNPNINHLHGTDLRRFGGLFIVLH